MALIDTGAEIPVCTLPGETLRKLFHAEKIVSHKPIFDFDKFHTLTVNTPEDESNVRRLCIYDKDGRLHILCESTITTEGTREES